VDSHAFRDSLRLLRTRHFGTFCFASLLSNIGTWAQQVAQPWLLLSLGASSFVVGLDSFALGAPVWLLTIAGGVLADRSDRRRVPSKFLPKFLTVDAARHELSQLASGSVLDISLLRVGH
jgi:MFS family permease